MTDQLLAEGRLKALRSAHSCGEACTAVVTLGGQERRLRCPLAQLDPAEARDQRVIGSLYAYEARKSLPIV